jgi:hypothetical protein
VGWPGEWITVENPVLGPVWVCHVDKCTRSSRIECDNVIKAATPLWYWQPSRKQQLRVNGGCLSSTRKGGKLLTLCSVRTRNAAETDADADRTGDAFGRYMRRPIRNSPALRCIGEKQGRCMRVDSVAAITASSPDPACLLSIPCLLVSSRQID